MKERELRLSMQLIELQSQFNEMTAVKDWWRSKYHEQRKELMEVYYKLVESINLLEKHGIEHDITELPF